MSKTKTAPNNDLPEAQPSLPPEKPRDYGPLPSDAPQQAAETPKPEKKPRRRTSLNCQLLNKVDLLLQEAAEGSADGDIAILDFLAKNRGWALMYTGSPNQVFDRR